MGEPIHVVIADEIWMEDFRGNGSSCIMVAFAINNAPNSDDLWAPFKAAIADGNPGYRGGIVAAAEFSFVGCIKGRLIYASSQIEAPVRLEDAASKRLVQITMRSAKGCAEAQ